MGLGGLTLCASLMRAFIFAVWVKAGKTAEDTLSALEALSAQHFTVAESGGRQMLTASVQGKSFSYEIPPGLDSSYFASLAYEDWKAISAGGASGGKMTDAELVAFVQDASGAVTNVARARFSGSASTRF